MTQSSSSQLRTHFIPAEQPGQPRLMIVLHGLGDSLAGWTWLPDALRLPWLNFMLVNAPDPYGPGYSWYDINTGEGIARSRGLLFQLLDSIQDYPDEQIILSGFSQGCLMSLEVGARYPHRLAGVVGISGYLQEPERLITELSPLAKEQKFLVTHGTHDPLIPIEKVRGQIALLRQAGLQVDWREFHKAHTVAGETEISVIRKFVTACYAVKT
jgi:phospholipase/carboxylesterase